MPPLSRGALWSVWLWGFLFLLAASNAAEAISLLGPTLPPHARGLALLVKQECKTKKVCLELADSSACKNPPCCKRFRLEKICSAEGGTVQGCLLCRSKGPGKGYCFPAATLDDCLRSKSAGEREFPNLKWSCKCGGAPEP